MSQPIKIILNWDIKPESDGEYFEFMISEFIPEINRLGLSNIEAWYTVFGDCEQIVFSGISKDEKEMKVILGSESWETLMERLNDLVTNFSRKVISNASNGFQM